MTTLTFYSYKGGTGRSLALANAARYLARLEFKVVALDLDLEAPGLHYKFLRPVSEAPAQITLGVADYIQEIMVRGTRPSSIKDFTLDVEVPGQEKRLLQLIPAGKVPSKEYWRTLSQINWHDLFYSRDGVGVEMFLDLKSRIADELNPDFLLIDARTGITEMGGVATTLLADKVVCLVLPTLENLEGSRAVLRSLRRSRREIGNGDFEVLLALSRLPEMPDGDERAFVKRILDVLNEPADDPADTLRCRNPLILHSEISLQLRETLRIGGNVSPDDSVLLRDYLRLFSHVIPTELVEPKIGRLIQQAKARIWDDPDGAMKEIEELAESFGRPEIYRELLRFYEVRNVSGERLLRRAQRLWDLTRDSSDIVLWQAVSAAFKPKERWQRKDGEWSPDLGFVEAVWRGAGKKQAVFGTLLANAWSAEEQPSRAADVALDVLDTSDSSGRWAARCVEWLDAAGRKKEADDLIRSLGERLVGDGEFLDAWAEHALRDKDALSALRQASNAMEALKAKRPATAVRVLLKLGLKAEALLLADAALQDVANDPSRSRIFAVGELFSELGRFAQFEESVKEKIPSYLADELQDRFRRVRRR